MRTKRKARGDTHVHLYLSCRKKKRTNNVDTLINEMCEGYGIPHPTYLLGLIFASMSRSSIQPQVDLPQQLPMDLCHQSQVSLPHQSPVDLPHHSSVDLPVNVQWTLKYMPELGYLLTVYQI